MALKLTPSYGSWIRIEHPDGSLMRVRVQESRNEYGKPMLTFDGPREIKVGIEKGDEPRAGGGHA